MKKIFYSQNPVRNESELYFVTIFKEGYSWDFGKTINEYKYSYIKNVDNYEKTLEYYKQHNWPEILEYE